MINNTFPAISPSRNIHEAPYLIWNEGERPPHKAELAAISMKGTSLASFKSSFFLNFRAFTFHVSEAQERANVPSLPVTHSPYPPSQRLTPKQKEGSAAGKKTKEKMTGTEKKKLVAVCPFRGLNTNFCLSLLKTSNLAFFFSVLSLKLKLDHYGTIYYSAWI